MFRDPIFFVPTRTSGDDGTWGTGSRRCDNLGLLGLGEVCEVSEVGTTSKEADDDKVSYPPGGVGFSRCPNRSNRRGSETYNFQSRREISGSTIVTMES